MAEREVRSSDFINLRTTPTAKTKKSELAELIKAAKESEEGLEEEDEEAPDFGEEEEEEDEDDEEIEVAPVKKKKRPAPDMDSLIMRPDEVKRVRKIVVKALMGKQQLIDLLNILPADAKVARSAYNTDTNESSLMVISKDFSIVEEGEVIPKFEYSVSDDGTVAAVKGPEDFLGALEDL